MARAVAPAPGTPKSCSIITNGRRLLQRGIDGRSTEARRFRDICQALSAQYGGLKGLNEAEKALIRKAAAMTVRSEMLQAASVVGREVDDEQAVRLANASARLMNAVARMRTPPAPPRSRFTKPRKAPKPPAPPILLATLCAVIARRRDREHTGEVQKRTVLADSEFEWALSKWVDDPHGQDASVTLKLEQSGIVVHVSSRESAVCMLRAELQHRKEAREAMI